MKKLRMQAKRYVNHRRLQNVAITMLPFYRAIAGNEAYARRWSKAVTKTDLGKMGRLMRTVVPRMKPQTISTNGIGYSVAFPIARTYLEWTNGTTIPPGTVQFTFSTRVHRAIARAVLPLYRELARNRVFAAAFAKAVRERRTADVGRMVRKFVSTPALKRIVTGVEMGGVGLEFKYSFNKDRYRNLIVLQVN